jgi:hypothetical protein
MKRALAWRAACAIIGGAFSIFGCSDGSNPRLPVSVPSLDGGLGERGLAQPDSKVPALDSRSDRDVGQDMQDAPIFDDGATAIDGAQPSKIIVTVLSPADSSNGDGGIAAVPVVAKSDRLAPSVRVEIQSRGGDPTADVLATVVATLINVKSKAGMVSTTLNQTQYNSVPESDDKIYLFSDTPFDLSGIPGDFYDLQVNATTVSGLSATTSVRIFLDAGPKITFLQPSEGVFVKGSVLVTATITDSEANVASVVFSVGQNQIDPTLILTNGSQYSTTIDFGSYDPPLNGGQIVSVSATNSNGIISIASRKFTIDNDGPAISGTKPVTGGLIGKLITIEVKVDDPAGVMPSSVIAVVAHGDVHFEVSLIKGSDGLYRQLFDTTQLPTYTIFPSISFRAEDILGNQSTVGYLLSLDNTPPILDLDPPDTFQLIKKDGVCSWPFDPVGPDAIDDGSLVNQLFDIRARIEDEGNTPNTGTADYIPIASVDPATVKVLILDDTSLPLVVDSSDPPDGICDDINPELIPSVSPQSSKDAQLLDMVPMPANTGAGDFTPMPGVACSGLDTAPPAPICETAYSSIKHKVMTYSLGYSANGLPSIWTIAPIVADGLQCAGRQFDASNNLKDGWACVAVEASDKVGNKQVSRPIRICISGTLGSTACSETGVGGGEVASITLPSSYSGQVVVTTKGPLTGRGGSALVAGDEVIFTNVNPKPFSAINGTHKISPKDTSGTSFTITNLNVAPLALYLDYLDGKPPVLSGTVGIIGQDDASLQVVTDLNGTSLDPSFMGKVVLMSGGAPGAGDIRWSVSNITTTGFTLPSTVALSGIAIASSSLPSCTGTVIKQASGLPVKVDGTKPCKPWMNFPAYEAKLLK